MLLISPNFDVKSIIFFPNFGQGPFPKIAGKGPAISSAVFQVDIPVDEELMKTVEQIDANHDGKITYEEFLVTQFQICLTEKDMK